MEGFVGKPGGLVVGLVEGHLKVTACGEMGSGRKGG